MATTDKNKKPVPLGKPLDLSNAQLDEMSQVTPADIAKAQALWRNSVASEFKTLLDAQAVELQKPNKKGTA